jgi:hypothetical protein
MEGSAAPQCTNLVHSVSPSETKRLDNASGTFSIRYSQYPIHLAPIHLTTDNAMTTPLKPATPLPFDTPEHWLSLARSERTFAAQERSSRHGTVESIRIHEQNAAEYEARAAALKGKE